MTIQLLDWTWYYLNIYLIIDNILDYFITRYYLLIYHIKYLRLHSIYHFFQVKLSSAKNNKLRLNLPNLVSSPHYHMTTR